MSPIVLRMCNALSPGTALLLLLAALLSPAAGAQPIFIPWQTVSEGMGNATDANLRTVSVLGQVVAGRSADGNTVITSGFLAGLRSSYAGTVEVEDIAASTAGFSLSQNYPNPFGTSSASGVSATTIAYALGARSQVQLRIVDVLGRNIATLLDAVQDAGPHTIAWNAAALTAGLYLCRMEAQAIDGSSEYARQRVLLLQK